MKAWCTKDIIESIKKVGEETTKKSLTQNLSKILLELEFKSDHSMKFRALKVIVKKILPAL